MRALRCVLCGCLVLTLGAFGAPAGSAEQTLKTIQDEGDALRLQLRVLSELTRFMSEVRTQVRGYCYIAGQYIESLDKLEEYNRTEVRVGPSPAELVDMLNRGERFGDAGIVVPSDPMSFDTARSTAAELVLAEGFKPADIAGVAELDVLKRMVPVREQLARRVFDSLRDQVNQAWGMRLFLESVGKLDAYEAYHAAELKRAEAGLPKKAATAAGPAPALSRQRMTTQMASRWQDYREEQYRTARAQLSDDVRPAAARPGAKPAARAAAPASRSAAPAARSGARPAARTAKPGPAPAKSASGRRSSTARTLDVSGGISSFRGYPGRRYSDYGNKYQRPVSRTRPSSSSRSTGRSSGPSRSSGRSGSSRRSSGPRGRR